MFEMSLVTSRDLPNMQGRAKREGEEMKQYQKDAIKLAREILSQPEPKSSKYSPPWWCSLHVVNEECHQLRREQCQTCQWFKKEINES